MINPSNIDIEAHTADFSCSIHGGSVAALNLNTDATYVEGNIAVEVSGSKLTETCECIAFFPTEGSNSDAQAIAEAKTE